MPDDLTDIPGYLRSYVWDWRDLQCDLQRLKMQLEQLVLPTEEQAKRHRSEQRRKGKEPLNIRLMWEHTLYLGDKNDIKSINFFNDDLASSERDFLIVERAISAKEFSCEFVRSWGNLQRLAGRLHEIRHNQLRAEGVFKRSSDSGNAASNELQRVWYARSMLALCPEWKPQARDRANKAIASYCREIFQGQREPPDDFHRAWFGRLITGESKEPGGKRPRVSEVRDGKPVVILVSLAAKGLKALKDLAATEVGAIPPLPEKSGTKIFLTPKGS